ncbi:hypothetical protein TRFO_22118 [Tritrichomonas foetus]|uniref:CS domain-containing protein n=1 Tax=Tritrichomonas foetus TaxID=1144522 RepID=A0A1J4KII5_9EUKA|nr:hypothetical protein TRFO_22118 [Tritrichomonas foetus]|eukprot:OHT09117.1 hypothetical protein TRFO_22118 [Tritrichomonas foetus]
MINPALSSLYQWKMDQDANSVVVELPFPETPFNPEILTVSLQEDKAILIVEIPGEIPFIQGVLYKECKSFTSRFDDNSFYLTLNKEDSEIWPYLMSDFNPNNSKMDPKSSYDLFDFAQKTQNPDMIQKSMNYLDISISEGYVPALRLASEISLRSKENIELGMNLLKIAAYTYQDVSSMLKLALHYEMNKDTIDDAFTLFTTAAKKGAILGMSFLGQMISPLSDISFHHKDAIKAAQLFESVLENDPDECVSLYEYSKLLYFGVGVNEDKNKALDMYNKVKLSEPSIPPLESLTFDESVLNGGKTGENGKQSKKEKKKFLNPFNSIVIISCISFILASASILYVRKRRK